MHESPTLPCLHTVPSQVLCHFHFISFSCSLIMLPLSIVYFLLFEREHILKDPVHVSSAPTSSLSVQVETVDSFLCTNSSEWVVQRDVLPFFSKNLTLLPLFVCLYGWASQVIGLSFLSVWCNFEFENIVSVNNIFPLLRKHKTKFTQLL